MKRKEIKALAQKIAKFELIIRDSEDAEERRKAEDEINKLCGPDHVKNWEDMTAIDEAVQEILEKT